MVNQRRGRRRGRRVRDVHKNITHAKEIKK